MARNQHIPRRLLEGLDEADELLERYGRPAEALEILNKLRKRYPKDENVLMMMVNACLDLGDLRGQLNAFYRLHKLAPNRAVVKFGLAGSYMSMGRIALAYQTFTEFIKKWKHDDRVDDAKNALAALETALDDILPDLDEDRDKALKFAAQHELVQVLMGLGEYRQAKQLLTRLLKTRADFMPLYNNLSLIAWLQGDLPEAVKQAEKVLTFEPANIHALSNLTRYTFLLGEVEEAYAYAERLIASEDEVFDFWVKKFEALTYVEKFEQVLMIFEKAKQAGEEEELNGLALHWVASAFFVTGDEKNAKKYWRKARKAEPTLEFAEDNLTALKKPLGDRDCPQIFDIDAWLSRSVFTKLDTMLAKISNKNLSDEDFYRTVQKTFDQNPEILSFVRAALKYGTADAKETALNFLDMSGGQPDLLEAAKEFALGQMGTEKKRLEAFQILSKYGAISMGDSVQLYLKGKWQEIKPMNYEISYEEFDAPEYPKKVLRLTEEGIEALRARDGVAGEKYFRQALALYPDSPMLLNNFASSLELQGKIDEAGAIADRIVEEFPDYFFGQLIVARRAMHAGDMDKAEEVIERMASKKRLHVTEFAALCEVHVQYFLQIEEFNVAMSWYQTWEQGYPEDPNRARYEEQMETIGLMEKIQSMDGFGNRKKH